MKFRPNPLLYGSNENFYGSFRIAVTMRSEVDHDVLSRSVEKAMVRYPYFSVSCEKEGNSLILKSNSRPVPVFNDAHCAILGSEESNGHLLTFGCEKNKIFLDISHYVADGMGVDPLLKTVLYLYVSELYGNEGLAFEKINMPNDAVNEEEYEYPFFEEPRELDPMYMPKKAPSEVYALDPNSFDEDGLYAYYLHIPQKAMMTKANPSDGSPVSYLSVMLFRAFCSLDSNIDLPVVGHVQHQYRFALKTPMNRHSLVSYVSAVLPAKANKWEIDQQNTVIRGQIILGSEVTADLGAVNRLIEAFPDRDDVSLEEKERSMREYIENSICGKTFGISYVGKAEWYGMDKYVEDIHVYIGEKDTKNMLLLEVMTIGEDFSITFMQSGRGRRYVDAFIEQLNAFDIPANVVGEGRYSLCVTRIPQ